MGFNAAKRGATSHGGQLEQGDLWLIAEQFHSGKSIQQIDFEEARLSLDEKLERLETALMRYPTPDSVWGGSNEVALPVQSKPSAHQGNVHPLVVSKNSFIPLPTLPSKTRQKLTVMDLRRKVQLMDALCCQHRLSGSPINCMGAALELDTFDLEAVMEELTDSGKSVLVSRHVRLRKRRKANQIMEADLGTVAI
jgi:hypothetical protein